MPICRSIDALDGLSRTDQYAHASTIEAMNGPTSVNHKVGHCVAHSTSSRTYCVASRSVTLLTVSGGMLLRSTARNTASHSSRLVAASTMPMRLAAIASSMWVPRRLRR